MSESVKGVGPLALVAGEKVPVGIALLADSTQIIAAYLEAPAGFRSGLMAASLFITVGIIVWLAPRWKENGFALTVVVLGILVAIAVLLWPADWHLRFQRGSGIPPTYFAKVSAFAYDPRDGTINTDAPLSGIKITARDQYNHVIIYHTGANGTQILPLEAYGPMAIGACGVFQTHVIEEGNNSPANAYTVQIAVDPTQVQACRE